MTDKDCCEAHGLFRPCSDCTEQGVIEIGLHDDLQADYDLLKGDHEQLEASCDRQAAEIKKLREFVQEVREFDPRTDHYATELHGDACEVLGLCRCCAQEVCDDA